MQPGRRTHSLRCSYVLLVALAGCDSGPLFMPPTTPPSDAELVLERRYEVKVPTGYDATKAWPVLLALHGYGGSGTELTDYFELDAAADKHGIFYVAPEAINYEWHPGPKAEWPYWDQPWLTAIIHDLEGRYHIDTSRVIVFGFSQGAHMAHRMGCDGAADVTTVVSLAGQVSTLPAECAPGRPVTVLQIHGTADESIGYEGDVQHTPPDPRVPSAHATVGVWARNDGCGGQLAAAPGGMLDLSGTVEGPETTPEQYAGCPAGIDVALWTMQGVMHRPDPTPTFSEQLLAFALAHPRR